MSEAALHRQLFSATKLLLHRFERNCEIYHHLGPHRADWVAISAVYRALAESSHFMDKRLRAQQIEDCRAAVGLPPSTL